MKSIVLATGGAGYIGSHVVRTLLDAGFEVVVLDNFYSGQRWAVDSRATLVEGAVGDAACLDRVFAQFKIESVLHFAAHIEVAESVEVPTKYYRNNTMGTLTLVEACLRHKVRHFIFSSTAAVYGNASNEPVKETTPLGPINPYGHSKLMSEQMIRDVAGSMPSVILRYFNAAGASLDGKLGQATPRATHLIKVAAEVACGKRSHLEIFGTDYATPDGTCVRDYIHVEDLAQAHVAALKHLRDGGPPRIFNCGYGRGSSVLDVIKSFEKILGHTLPVVKAARRAGDAVSLVADSSRLKAELGWQPAHQSLDLICKTAYEWEKQLQARTVAQ